MEIDEPVKRAPAKPSEPSLDPKLRQRLSTLMDPSLLHSIATRASDSNSGYEPTVSAGFFFLELISRSKTARDQVLTVVAAVQPVMRQFWKAARTSGLGPKFLTGKATDAEKDALAGLLAPLAGGYSRRLVTMDDTDFTSGESRGVFAMPDIVDLSALLRDIAVNLHLAPKIPPGEVGARLIGLRREATAVLRDLHDWDARRPFCPAGHWLHATVDIRADTLPLNLFEQPDEDVLEDGQEEVEPDHGRLTSSQSANARSVQLLRYLPFVIPFSGRVRLFQRLLEQDGSSRANTFEQIMGSAQARVRRPYLYEDGFEKLSGESNRLKGRIRIQLIDEHGLEEAGIDGGGLFKEFLTELLKKGFDPALGFFKETTQNLLYPNPESMAVHGPEALQHYEFLGKMVGKAVYERILVELPLAQFFLRKMLKRPCSIGDLASLDEDLSRHLLYIKNYRGDFADLALTFSVTDSTLGQNRTVDLIPNGRNVDVTAQNRLQFVYLWANYRLNVSIRAQCEAFLRGMQALIEPAWLQMFDERELQVLISGAEMPVDVDDLRRHTAYSGGYTNDHPTIALFWEVVRGFDDAEKRKLLKFATSCSRPPLLGFKELHPQFAIHSAGRESADRLPTASTCMNLLKLPEFRDKESMKKKLVYAIEAGAGFDLS
jgi:ubiquitin-protein ligase E3 C